jgi:hypothetical protein
MDFYARGIQAFEQGRARTARNRLAELSSAALSAPVGQRGQFASQIAAIDPDAGFSFDQGIQRQQQAMQAESERRLGNMAKLLSVAPSEARGNLWSRIRPGLQSMGYEAPEAWDDSLLPVVQQLGGGQSQQASLTPSMQSLIWQRENKIISDDEFRQAVRILNRQDAAAQNQRYSVQSTELDDGTVRYDRIPTIGGNVAGAPAPAPRRDIQITPAGEVPMPTGSALEQIMAGMASGQPFSVAVPPTGAPTMTRPAASGPSAAEMDRRANSTLDAKTYGPRAGQATNASRAAAKAEEAGLVREQEDLSRMGTERLGEIRGAARVAATEMASLTELERLLSQVNTGAFAETRINLGRAASFLGFSDGAEVSAAEAAASIANRLALALRNPAGGEGMPGAMSDADRNFLVSTIPSIQNSPNGWRQMIEIRRRLATAAQEQAEEAERFMREGGRSRDLPGRMAEWSRQRRLFADMEARGGSAASADDEALINRYLQGQ